MKIMSQDKRVLKGLAFAYRLMVEHEHNQERAKLHRASNDLKMIRPVVLIDELPWSEMNIDHELDLWCTDPYLRTIEQFMRRELYKFKHLRADMIVRPFIPIPKVISNNGIGITIQEETLATNGANNIVSHEYVDQLEDDDALSKLHKTTVTYHEEETMRRYEMVAEMIDEFIPLRVTGIDHLTMHPWDDIAMWRGVTPLLMSLAEDPEFCHRMMRKITDIRMDEQEQLLKLGLFDSNPWSLHCTPILSDDLHLDSCNGQVGFENLWGRGTAQIFASVGKDIHEEFDIDYMTDTIGKCGLVYYGCCEPLDKKMDVVEKIPNLRKVSITPWADVQVGAEAIGKKYVLSSKPNPSAVAVSQLDKDALRKEIGNILDACKRNGCSCDLVLKDISTCNFRPENIFEWEKIVMEMVQGM